MNTSPIDQLRTDLRAAAGTQEDKARQLGISVSWLQKFLDGRIKYPRADRYEYLREQVQKLAA